MANKKPAAMAITFVIIVAVASSALVMVANPFSISGSAYSNTPLDMFSNLMTGTFNSMIDTLNAAVSAASRGSGGGKTAPQCSDHVDNDGDGYCDYALSRAYCNGGAVLGDPDCVSKTDTSESCTPTDERCDGKDNDCDGAVDEDGVCTTNYYCDSDGDSYYSSSASGSASVPNLVPAGCSTAGGNDCDDSVYSINPGATENCDSDGKDNDCDGAIDECCSELFPGTNNMSADRVNVVFVGMLYPNNTRFISDAMSAIDYYGSISSYGPSLLELPGYRDNKQKFNFWYVEDILSPATMPITTCTQCNSTMAYSYCGGLPNTRVVNLCNADFRGCAYLGGSSHIATFGSYATYWPYVFNHEFQHQFPMLLDEYTETGFGDRPGSPNCAPDLATARTWWGAYENMSGADGKRVGYYDGCSYVTGNYRPVLDSIMRSWVFNLGLINELKINSTLSAFSGTSSEFQNAVKFTLEGSPGDIRSYRVTAMSPAVVKSTEKPNGKMYRLKIKTPESEFSGYFDMETELITEDFDPRAKTIRLVSVEKRGLTVINVTVPIGKNRFDGEARTIVGNTAPNDFAVEIDDVNGNPLTTL